MSPGNSAPGTKSSVVTGIASGGDRSSTQSPKRRMVWVMYGEIVARSSVSIGCPSPARAFAAAVMSPVSRRSPDYGSAARSASMPVK